MALQRLTLERLLATAGGRSWTSKPYAPVAGFRSDWWLGDVAGKAKDWFTFRDSQHEELVRAEVEPHADTARGYQGVMVPADGFAQITYFEVRADRRGDDFGTEAAELLTRFYQGRSLAAFSEQADDFWTSVGWTPHRPLLEPDDYEGHYQTFYVSP